MKKFIPCFIIIISALSLIAGFSCAAFSGTPSAPLTREADYAGSQSCRECHDRFYKLWSTSFHGLAMQPYSSGFATGRILPQKNETRIGDFSYKIDESFDSVIEKGPDGIRNYRIDHVMGGKYVYYFLTGLEKGKLQTLPIAFDVRRKEWFDTALSAVRHFPDQSGSSKPNNWKDVPYTFNTACHDCHVSQRQSSYDQNTDSFSTSWKESGINCETCHGPSDEHNRVMKTLPKGEKPVDYKLVRTKLFTPAQHNDSCSSCHAKSAHLTRGYKAPERFFDHFDLVTLEDSDYYPDGRDLGENYTMTSWMLSPCAKGGKLHCINCHTSSGRYRFRKTEDANKACLPCHEKRVSNPTPHTRHKEGSSGSHCIACHMPKTEFARMSRSDHSMRPPTPSATILYKSPNACNNCHNEKDAEWADRTVRSWHSRDYQAPYLKRAELIDRARKRLWQKLDEMLAYINSSSRDEVFATSLIRLLQDADPARTTPALLKAIKDPSPLVRGASADTLSRNPSPEVLQALAEATGDDFRLVRVMAAGALSGYQGYQAPPQHASRITKATEEYLEVLESRPINWMAQYNLGNYYLNRNQPDKALEKYNEALRLSPEAVMPRANASIALVQLGKKEKAEQLLAEVVVLAPDMAVAHYNLGMLTGERGDLQRAEKHLRKAIAINPGLADAAYRLCLILSSGKTQEAVYWCRKAAEINPAEIAYGYALAFNQSKAGDIAGAMDSLSALLQHAPAFGPAWLMQAELYQLNGNTESAIRVYQQMSEALAIGEDYRRIAEDRLETIRDTGTSPAASDK